MKFSRRITLSILALVAGTSGVGVIIAHRQVTRAQEQGARAIFDLEARATRERQSLRLDATRQVIGDLERNSFLFAALVEEDWKGLYDNGQYELRKLKAKHAYFLDSDGAPIAHAQRSLGPLGESIQAALPSAKDEQFGEPLRPACVLHDGALYEVLRQPVIDVNTDEPAGWIVAAWPYVWPAGESAGESAGATLYAMAIGSQIALPPDQPLGEWLSVVLSTQFPRGGESLEATAPNGTPYSVRAFIVAGAATATVQFVVVQNLAESVAARNRTNAFFLTTAAVALCVGGLLSHWMGKSLSTPVAVLGEAARAIGHGKYDVRVQLTGADEFLALGGTFNTMAHGLEMRDKYRNVLDAVADPSVAEELVAGELNQRGRTVDAGILFCDIRGFTQTTENMTPDDVIEMLNAHMSAMCGVIYQHGGMVDKFVGDLVMAVWGAPKSSPDDALRLARCAIAMQEERARLNESIARPIAVGIGIAFGPVVAGCMGSATRINYTVLGARVNLASRLCSSAKAGQVVADSLVRERLDATILAEALTPFQVKGFQDPVQAFVLSKA